MIDTQRCRRVVGDVGLDRAVDDTDLVVDCIDETVLGRKRADQATAHPARLGQRSGHVTFDALAIPRTHYRVDAGLVLIGSLLETHVDGTGRLACPAEKTGRPAQDFDMVDHNHVRLGAVDRRDRRRKAVHVKRVIFEAARIKAGATIVIGQNHNARRLAHDGIERRKIAVVETFARHHGGRLRHFAQGARVLVADADFLRRIAVRAFSLVGRTF
ncbi:hypothetical protein D3C71_795510 [compost metagenome]